MNAVNDFFQDLANLRASQQMIDFVDRNLLLFVFMCLAFGFAVLLVEIRLPLKYYWNLPVFLFKSFLQNFGLLKKSPVWGRCIDRKTNQPIPLTAIEILDHDKRNVVEATFSDRLGEYGFDVSPGKYIIRAIKNYYNAPPFFDPENIRLHATDESLAIPVEVKANFTPSLNLIMQPAYLVDTSTLLYKLIIYFRAFALSLANGFLVLAVLGSWYGWVLARSSLYAILLAVAVVFMFIKLYILEAVGSASRN